MGAVCEAIIANQFQYTHQCLFTILLFFCYTELRVEILEISMKMKYLPNVNHVFFLYFTDFTVITSTQRFLWAAQQTVWCNVHQCDLHLANSYLSPVVHSSHLYIPLTCNVNPPYIPFTFNVRPLSLPFTWNGRPLYIPLTCNVCPL